MCPRTPRLLFAVQEASALQLRLKRRRQAHILVAVVMRLTTFCVPNCAGDRLGAPPLRQSFGKNDAQKGQHSSRPKAVFDRLLNLDRDLTKFVPSFSTK